MARRVSGAATKRAATGVARRSAGKRLRFRRLASAGLLAGFVLAVPASAQTTERLSEMLHVGQEPLRPTTPIQSVRIEVTWVGSRAELETKRREYGTPQPTNSVIRETLKAFSVLGRRNGELVCLIFAPKPARFDDRVNTSLGHELLHCFGFNHGG